MASMQKQLLVSRLFSEGLAAVYRHKIIIIVWKLCSRATDLDFTSTENQESVPKKDSPLSKQ